jgi:hypothetical protein
MKQVTLTRDMRPWHAGATPIVPDDLADRLVAAGDARDPRPFPPPPEGPALAQGYLTKGAAFLAALWLATGAFGPDAARAANQYPDGGAGAAAGQSIGAVVGECVNTAGQAVPPNVDTGALVTLAAQGAGTVISTDQANHCGRGVVVVVSLTTMTSATVVVHVQGKDMASGSYYDILVSASLASTGVTVLTVYPGAATTANVSSPQPLPATWRVSAVVTGASAAATGTIGASVIQ